MMRVTVRIIRGALLVRRGCVAWLGPGLGSGTAEIGPRLVEWF